MWFNDALWLILILEFFLTWYVLKMITLGENDYHKTTDSR